MLSQYSKIICNFSKLVNSAIMSSLLPPLSSSAEQNNNMALVPASSSNLMGLLDDLHQTRVNVENDQKAYEQSRQELNALNYKLKELGEKKLATEKKIQEVELSYASTASDYSHVKIKDKVISESLVQVQKDLDESWDKLRDVRTKVMSVSNHYLNDCCNFAMMYNCTELGSRNRAEANEKDLDEMRRQKQQLEHDLQQFISMQTQVEESEKENEELENQYKIQEEAEQKREMETYKQLSEVEGTLEKLEKQQNSLDNKLQEELNRLQRQLQIVKESISYWERRVSENQRRVSNQRNSVCATNTTKNGSMNVSKNIATCPGLPLINANSVQLGNGQTIATNNKAPRVFQFVKKNPKAQVLPVGPAPKFQVPKVPGPGPTKATKITQYYKFE